MNQLVIYVHGKGGNAEEAEHYKSIFVDSEIVGFDYHASNPRDAINEFAEFYDKQVNSYDSIILIANSLGAYFSLLAFHEKKIDRTFLISPIVNMEQLILDMLKWAKASEKELAEKKIIKTDFGEVLSWEDLCFVRNNPIKWNMPTFILYGEKDEMTSYETISSFANRIDAKLTVMENGEHWFHKEAQMKFLDSWMLESMGTNKL